MSNFGRFKARVWRYSWNLAIAFDQLANAVVGGHCDETLSSRAHKARDRWREQPRPRYLWGCVLCNFLDWLWKDHCLKSCERDEGKPK